MRSTALAAVLLLAGHVPAAAVDPGLLGLVGPEVNFAVGIRVGDLASSPFFATALEMAPSGEEGGAWSEFRRQLGDNPLAGIEEILLVGRVESGDADEPVDDVLVLARGDFAGNRLRQAFCSSGCQDVSHGGVALAAAEHEGKSVLFGALNDRYALMGPEAKVREALDRRARPSPAAGRAAEIEQWSRSLGGHHVWLAASGPFEAPSSDDAPPMAAEMLRSLEAIGLGLTLGDDLVLGLDLRARGEAESRNLHTAIQGLAAMAAMAGPPPDGKTPAVGEFLQGLKLELDGSRVTAELRVPGGELERAMTFRFGDGDGEEQVAAAPAARPAPRPRVGKIRIHGLGDEPIEVDAGNQE